VRNAQYGQHKGQYARDGQILGAGVTARTSLPDAMSGSGGIRSIVAVPKALKFWNIGWAINLAIAAEIRGD
jgi:hypothetical protein